MLDLSSDFEADYSVDRIQEADTRKSDFYFSKPESINRPELSVDSKEPRLNLRITPKNGISWEGQFEAGSGMAHGIYSTPSKTHICIVVNGRGYWVDVLNPKSFEIIRSNPIKSVIADIQAKCVLFIDYVRISAYGKDGFIWMTEDLSWDGVSIHRIGAGKIYGEGWDSPADKSAAFIVDLVTGEVEGGSSPSRYGA